MMPSRYEYDLDGNKEWRWIAIAANGATVAISPAGYASLHDCMHAVGLMQAPGARAAMAGTGRHADPPQSSLSSLHRRS